VSPLRMYRCIECGREWEILESMHGEIRPQDKCPRCKGRNIRRVITAPAVHFKGSGFYENDYKEKK